MTINDMAQRAYDTAVAKGFHEEPRNFGEVLALVHSELSEALDAHRNFKTYLKGVLEDHRISSTRNDLDDQSLIIGYISEDNIYFEAQSIMDLAKERQKDHIAEEFADAVIRIGDMAKEFGVDLEAAIEGKMAYNDTRPYKHGKSY